MYFQTAYSTLCRQNLETYLFTSANILKQNPLYKLQPMIVQVISSECISDGITNFQCKSTRGPLKKGSFIRLIQWRLELNNFLIVVEQHQYLGGEGYQIRNGKPWDIQKLKLVIGSHFVSNDFIVLHTPNTVQNRCINNFRIKATEESHYSPIFSLHQCKRNQTYFDPKAKKQKGHEIPIDIKKKDKGEVTKQNEGIVQQKSKDFHNLRDNNRKQFSNQLKQAHTLLLHKIKEYNQENKNCKNTDFTQNEDINNKTYLFSKLDVQKAKKIKAPKYQPTQVTQVTKSKNLFSNFQNGNSLQSKLQKLDFHCEIPGKSQVKSQPVGEQSIDSNGRKVIFNKHQIHKLLGGE